MLNRARKKIFFTITLNLFIISKIYIFKGVIMDDNAIRYLYLYILDNTYHICHLFTIKKILEFSGLQN